jgi:hypothetical protein
MANRQAALLGKTRIGEQRAVRLLGAVKGTSPRNSFPANKPNMVA